MRRCDSFDGGRSGSERHLVQAHGSRCCTKVRCNGGISVCARPPAARSAVRHTIEGGRQNEQHRQSDRRSARRRVGERIVHARRSIHLELRQHGDDGNWRFNPNGGRGLSIGIVCYEHADRTASDVLVADCRGAVSPVDVGKYDTPDRWIVKMRHIRKVGVTRNNLRRFAAAGTNPVRFLSKAVCR